MTKIWTADGVEQKLLEKLLRSKVVKREKPISISSQFVQAPVLPCLFTDPDTKKEKCLVVLLMYNGVTTITYDVIESTDGSEPTLKVKYSWPTPMFDTNSMFKQDNEEEMFVQKLHPKVHAVEKALEKFRANMEDAPVGFINVKLPVEVQMDPNTWSLQ